MRAYLAALSLLIAIAATMTPATDAQAFCLFGCENNYDYNGPCPPSRPSILDKSVEELTEECIGQPCNDVLSGNVEAGNWENWSCSRKASSCRTASENARNDAADDHMNAQIVCRTAPPPSLGEICKAKNVCGQEIPLNGSCKWYCDNCYNIDPEGGLDPEKVIGDINAALNDAMGTLNNIMTIAAEVTSSLDGWQDIFQDLTDGAKLICNAAGEKDLYECSKKIMDKAGAECAFQNLENMENITSMMASFQDASNALKGAIDGIKGAFNPPPPPPNSCDGMNWDAQGPMEFIARAACDQLDNISSLGDLQGTMTDKLNDFAQKFVGSAECGMSAINAAGTALGLPVKPDNNKTKKAVAKLKKNMQALKDAPKSGTSFKGPLAKLKAACAIGKAGNKYIKCFGTPGGWGIGAKQVCEESHINCAPLLPAGTNRDSFIPRCNATY